MHAVLHLLELREKHRHPVQTRTVLNPGTGLVFLHRLRDWCPSRAANGLYDSQCWQLPLSCSAVTPGGCSWDAPIPRQAMKR